MFLAVVLFTVVTVWLRPHTPDLTLASAAEATPEDSGVSGVADFERTAPATEATHNPNAAATQSTVFVHVVGEVQLPGVYELAAGSRVSAAIEAAGGASAAAVLSGVNLARLLVDGEQIVVPDAAGTAAILPPSQGAGVTLGAGSLINLNTADASTLETLPRVGPALAQRILEWRSQHGSFSSVEQLLHVSGIGQKIFDQLRELVTV